MSEKTLEQFCIDEIVLPLLGVLHDRHPALRKYKVLQEYIRTPNLEATGSKLDLTRERTRQLKEKAMKRVRKDILGLWIEIRRGEFARELVDLNGVTLETLGLSSRAILTLKKCEISNLEQLLSKSKNELIKNRFMGKKSLEEIEEVLYHKGFFLHQETEQCS